MIGRRKTSPHPPLRGTFSHRGEKESVRFYRRDVVLLRTASVVFVALAVLSPGIRWSRPVKDAQIAVVWDGSASMGEKDSSSGESRWAAARAAWERVRGSLPEATLHSFVLDVGAHPVVDSTLNLFVPSANECSFDALGSVLSSSSTRAILLFSDGRSSDVAVTSPGAPVFAVGVGGEGNVPDIAVDAVEAPPLAYVGIPVDVTAHVTASGSPSPSVQVVLLENGKRRTQTTVSLSSGGASVPLRFTPSVAGLSRCEVRTVPVAGETRTANNGRRFAVNVQRERVRTLYIAGRPGPHYNFLRAQLKNDPSVELVSFVVLRDPEDALAYSDAELSLIPFPSALSLIAQLPTFDVVVLEEVSGIRFALGDAFFLALEKRVQDGGGFLSIQEPSLLSEGGPGSDTLARLSPWASSPSVSGPERFQLKVTDPDHPLLNLAEGVSNAARWAKLAPLEGAGRFFSRVKTGARVLAVEPVGGSPVLAERPFGRGRVLGVANTTSWRWALDGGRRGEGPADYQRFWENAVRWLASTPGSGSLRIVRPGGTLSPHDSWTVRLHAPRDLPRSPRLWAIGPDGKRVTLRPRATENFGEYAAAFVPPGPGTYELRSEAGESDRDNLWVDVSSEWDELSDTRPDFGRLRTLAGMSGGRFIEARNLTGNDLRRWVSKKLLEKRPQGAGTEVFFVALALSALVLEWIVRRRRGVP